MSAFTLAYRKVPNDAEISAVEAVVRAGGGEIAWQTDATRGRTYALVEKADERCAGALREKCGAAFVGRPIIALAVLPSVAEALPPILHALGGPGAPVGVRSCEAVGGAALIEWDLDRTGLPVVLGLIDIEIARFRARRVNALLSPLPLAWWARIAADGLAADVTPDRVLEALLEDDRVAG